MPDDLQRALAERFKEARFKPGLNGYKPHDKQKVFHESSHHGTLFLGGNRSGKTVGGAVESIYRLKGEHPYKEVPPAPVRGRSCSVDLLQGVQKIVLPEIAKWVPNSLLIDGSWEKSYSKSERVLHLSNGSFIEFLSYDQDLDKFAGTSRHFVWFDEEAPKDIFDECGARLVDTGGQWFMTMTPVEGMTWVYDDVYTSKDRKKYLIIEVEMTENPHIGEAEAELYLSGLTPEERKAREEGRFMSRTGMIYQNHLQAVHIIPPVGKDQLKGHMFFVGMDHGFTNPTAFLWAAVNSDGRIIIFDEYYQDKLTVEENAQQIHLKNQELGIAPTYYVGDPSIRNTDPITGTSIQIEYIEHGIPICLGNNDQKAGINKIISYLKGPVGNGREPYDHPLLYITENCVNLLWEMRKLQWGAWHSKKMQSQRNPKEEQHKKDDHACDALRYLISSRPETDDGTGLPESFAALNELVGASLAINPEEDLILPVGDSQVNYDSDFHLGNEF